MSKAAKFVTVKCQCGNSFDREVKRGRPQVWCPDCLAVPFYERVRAEAPTVVNDAGEAVVKSDTTTRPNDPLAEYRDAIEEGVAEINADHKVRFDALVAAGMERWEAGMVAQAETAKALVEFYGKYR